MDGIHTFMDLIHHHLKHPSLKIITHIIIHVTTTPLLHHPSPMPDRIGRMITIHQIQVPLMGMEEVSNHNHLQCQQAYRTLNIRRKVILYHPVILHLLLLDEIVMTPIDKIQMFRDILHHNHIKHPSLKVMTHNNIISRIHFQVRTTCILNNLCPMPNHIAKMITTLQIQVPLMGMEEVSNHNHLHHQRITCLKHICLVYSYLNKEVTIYVHHHIAMTRLGEKI